MKKKENVEEILENDINTTEEVVTEEVKEAEEVATEETVETQSLESRIVQLEAEVEDWRQAYTRKQADYQNFTKRKEKEAEDIRKFASEKIIGKLLDGIDNLTRAMDMSSQSKDFDGLVKGVDLTLNQFREVLKAEGLEPIETENKEYNPEEHMAVMVEENPDIENNFIIMELQKGYRLKGKVIRPSMVKVCKK